MVDGKIPLSRALLWILVSVLCIPGSAFMGWQYYLHVRDRRLHDDQYRLVAIVQRTSQGEALKTVYLAEFLDLSLDHPVNLYQFNVKEAERKLLACPLIKRASVKKILPGTIYVDYDLRVPLAYLGDYSNTALDEEGVLFPFHLFFTPKYMPIFYFGLKDREYSWGSYLKEHPSLPLALAVWKQLQQIQQEKFYVKQIDVSQSQADSSGNRQIVVVLEGFCYDGRQASQQATIFLRLSTDHYVQDIANFGTLWATLELKGDHWLDHRVVIIDLRLPHLAFIKKS